MSWLFSQALVAEYSAGNCSDGALFLGGAESVIGISSEYQPVSGVRGVYHLASGAAAPAAKPVAAAG